MFRFFNYQINSCTLWTVNVVATTSFANWLVFQIELYRHTKIIIYSFKEKKQIIRQNHFFSQFTNIQFLKVRLLTDFLKQTFKYCLLLDRSDEPILLSYTLLRKRKKKNVFKLCYRVACTMYYENNKFLLEVGISLSY